MIDLYGKSIDPLLENESNPGKVITSPGGVTRNITENLARLGLNTKIISSICSDPFGELIKKSLDSLDIDYSHSYFPEDKTSTIYIGILENDGEMKLALSDTTAIDEMPVNHIIQKESVIMKSQVIIIDASLPKEIIHYIVDEYPEKKIILDPVSVGKSHQLKDIIGKFHTVKCNKNEAEYLSGIKIVDKKTLKNAGTNLLNQGVQQVFITLGAEGVYYQNQKSFGSRESMATELVNVTGAGDAFTAGVAYCTLLNMDIESTADFASAMSSLSLSSMHAVNPKITLDKVNKILDNEMGGN